MDWKELAYAYRELVGALMSRNTGNVSMLMKRIEQMEKEGGMQQILDDKKSRRDKIIKLAEELRDNLRENLEDVI